MGSVRAGLLVGGCHCFDGMNLPVPSSVEHANPSPTTPLMRNFPRVVGSAALTDVTLVGFVVGRS